MDNQELAEQVVRDFTKERDERCLPIARELALLLGTKASEMPLGSSTSTEEKIEYFSTLVGETIIPTLEKYDVKIDEVGYVFSVLLEMVQQTFDRIEPTIQTAFEQATAYKWGVKDSGDITIGMVRELLTQKKDELLAKSENMSPENEVQGTEEEVVAEETATEAVEDTEVSTDEE